MKQPDCNHVSCERGIESLVRVPDCLSQLSYILVDRRSGERTILWKRDPWLPLLPRHLRKSWIENSTLPLIDGHDAIAAAHAAKWARKRSMSVVTDADNLYSGIEALLEHPDCLFTPANFPPD